MYCNPHLFRQLLAFFIKQSDQPTAILGPKDFLRFVASNKGHVVNGKRQGGVHGKAEALPIFTTGKAGRCPRQGGGSSNLHHRKGRAASTARRRLFQPSPPAAPGENGDGPGKGPISCGHTSTGPTPSIDSTLSPLSLSFSSCCLDSPTILVKILPGSRTGPLSRLLLPQNDQDRASSLLAAPNPWRAGRDQSAALTKPFNR